VARDGLAAALQVATQGDTSQRLFLRADTRVPYGELMATLDALRAAGYLKVALVGLEQGAR
jgi:biopolymer transport protein ExbD